MAADMLCGCSRKQLLRRLKDSTGGGQLESEEDYYRRRSLIREQRQSGADHCHGGRPTAVTSSVTSSSSSAHSNVGFRAATGLSGDVVGAGSGPDSALVKPRRRFPSPLLKPQRRVFVMAESYDSFDLWFTGDLNDSDGTDSAHTLEDCRVTAKLDSLLRDDEEKEKVNE
jgi:hypothetical protein